MKKLAAIMALCACCLSAQTAKVIALSPEDAAKAKALYQQRAELDKQIDELQIKIEQHYLPKGCRITLTGSTRQYSTGAVNGDKTCDPNEWLNGFEYSDDYRFIVPKTPATYPGPVTRLPYELQPRRPSISGIIYLNRR